MPRTVVDASFILAWALQQNSGIAYDAVLMQRGGVVPAICSLEVTLWHVAKPIGSRLDSHLPTCRQTRRIAFPARVPCLRPSVAGLNSVLALGPQRIVGTSAGRRAS
jgi:hypothetical protein